MKRVWILIIIATCPVLAVAQNPRTSTGNMNRTPYRPAAPPPSMVGSYGGWPAYGGTTTAAGSAMNGMSNVISSKGNYNLSTSAAAVNMTQAQSAEIQNRQQATDAYFEMRATNKAARAAEEGPKPTMEQLVKVAHDGVPKPLGEGQMDPTTGKLNWPGALQDDGFASQRAIIDRLMAEQANYGYMSHADQTKFRSTTDALLGELKARIKEIPPPDYVASRTFLNSLVYAVTKTKT
jgi:hypothetical protein